MLCSNYILFQWADLEPRYKGSILRPQQWNSHHHSFLHALLQPSSENARSAVRPAKPLNSPSVPAWARRGYQRELPSRRVTAAGLGAAIPAPSSLSFKTAPWDSGSVAAWDCVKVGLHFLSHGWQLYPFLSLSNQSPLLFPSLSGDNVSVAQQLGPRGSVAAQISVWTCVATSTYVTPCKLPVAQHFSLHICSEDNTSASKGLLYTVV